MNSGKNKKEVPSDTVTSFVLKSLESNMPERIQKAEKS